MTELDQPARGLLGAIGQRDVFSSAEWFDLLLRHCEFEGEPLFLANEGCVLPLVCKGRKLESLANYYTMRFAPIFDDEEAAAPYVDALLDHILEAKPGWQSVHLRSLPGVEPITSYVLWRFRSAGWRARLYSQNENWFHPTAGESSESYLKSRPSQLRNTIERKWRRANREHKILFQLYHTLKDADRAIADYQSIYSKSWKDPEAFPDFVPAFIKCCADKGALRLGVLYVDGVPAAAQFWIIVAGRATIYKLAYDDAYAEVSPGSILTKLMFQHALDHDRVDQVDYGTGSDSYKRDWMAYKRPIVGLIAYNLRTLSGLTLGVADVTNQAAKRLSLSHP